MKIDQCPRCHKDWIPSFYRYSTCISCRIDYNGPKDKYDILTYPWLAYNDFINIGDILYFCWYVDGTSHKCHYWDTEPTIEAKRIHIELPILPINITPDKLKALMVFI